MILKSNITCSVKTEYVLNENIEFSQDKHNNFYLKKKVASMFCFSHLLHLMPVNQQRYCECVCNSY